MKPKAVQNITRRPVFFRLVLWVCCIGLLGWSAAPAWAQCNYVRADSYLAFATANDYVSPSTGDYLGGYGPGDDKDGDGLTNRQEWDGWSTDVNGVLTYFGWRTAATAPAGAVLEPGGCLEDVDSDCDGMSDYVERSALTNPQNGDTDGDGMGDAWEVYVGLDPRDDGTVNPDNAPGADPDGDGLTSAEEMLGPGCIYSGLSCATKENPFTQPAFGEDDFTYPLHYDSDGDKLIDSYEYQSGHGLDPVVADDSGADPDADGLTSFREQCVHPLLANFWGANSFASGEFAVTVSYSVVGYSGARRAGLVVQGYMNLAQYNATGDSEAVPGLVLWGHPVERSSGCAFGGTRRWTSSGNADTDSDLLPDGWEVEHGLNPLAGSSLVENNVLHVSGPVGDPDLDDLYNLQEFFGQDGYRIDYITGTGDETDPWITRIYNHAHSSAYALRIGQIGVGGQGDRAPAGYADDFIATYAPDIFPGFFDPVAYAGGAGTYEPIPGVPPYVVLEDLLDPAVLPTPYIGSFNPFATALSGIIFRDNDADGLYTPTVDDVWLAVTAPGVYTVGDPIIANPGVALAGGEAGDPIVWNLSFKWPIPGWDTDDDGLPDVLEIQMDVAAGKQPTSPVQSHNPFRPRSARITSNGGLSPVLFDRVMDANGLKDGRRFFSRDFTVETWVFLADTGANDYQGAFIQGMVWFDGAGTFTRVGYELGVEPNAAGVVSVPYISFNTLADKRYKVSAASSLPKNRWVHLAGVYDHARNALSLYIDGLLEQSLQVLEESSSTFGISKGGMLTLALDNGGAESFADNLWLDEVRVWGVPRTSDEVADNRSRLIDPIQLTSAAIYTNVEPNALFAYYTFDDGGTSAEDLCRRAKSSLLGYAYPHDTNVITFLNQEYFYGDRAFALDSDDLKGAGNAFTFDGNRVSPVIGFVDAERGEFDSDRDGLPDSWEIVHELNPFKTNTPDHDQIEGYDPLWATTEGPAADWSRDLELPVGDGLNNLYEYWAHTNPRKIDTDEDGLYDGEEDFEGDGLPNRVEVLINSRPDLADTDDDEHGDSREQVDQTSPILSLSPEKNLLVRFDGQPGSYLDIFDRSTLRLNSWTLEAKVLPLTVTNLANGQGAAIVRRAVQETVNGLLAANFELRVVRVGTNLTAEARYVYVDNGGTGRVVKATGDPAAVERDRLSVQTDPTDPYPSSELVHLAATYDYNSGILSLYINGSLAARNTTALSRPPSNGRGPRSFVRVGEGFRGFVDDVRLWSGAATAAELLTRKDIDLTGNEAGLIAYYRVDDGGWQSHWTLPAILSVEADPGTVTTNIGDRYIVDTAAVGAWVGHDGDIAEFSESGIWVYTVPEDGSRVYNAAAAAVFEYDETLDSWSAAALPTLVRSVRYAAAPGTPKEGDTWRVGGNIFTRETGVTYSEAAPAKLFQEGAMLIGAAAGGDFAWWVSRDEFYRYDAGLAAWKRWGKAVQWLAEARARVKRLLATQAALFALPDTPVVGNTYAVVAPASFYTYMGGPWASADSWLIEPMNDGDRYISEFSGNVYDYDAGGPTMITIASATTDGGGLYLYVRSEGAAWRSDGAEWKRWGFVPTTEDFATTQDWLNQWARAAKLSGGGFFTKLATVVSSLDSDGDGLPDDWEIAHGLDPYDPTGDNGALGDPDGDGLNNLNEYLTGNHPNNPDTDGNGVWDGQEDYDKDGLSNNYEQDYTFTRLDRVDTDDDYLTDWEEVTGYDFTNTAVFAYAGERRPDRLSNPLRSLDPPQQMSGKFNGDGRLLVPHQTRHSLRSWTVHAWVWPSNLADGVVIRRAVTNEYLKRLAVNYELGVRTNAVGALIPYGRYIGLTTNGLPVEVRVDGTQTNEIVGGQQATVQIPSEQWTHLAASYDHEAHTLRLYINGDLASYRTEAFEPWGMGLYEGLDYKSELTVGGGNRTSATNVTQGFEGYIDEAVVMAGALEEDSVKSAATTPLSELAGVRAASVPESGTIKMLPIDEALMYEHHPDQLMVRFKPEVVPAQVPGLSAGLGIVSLHKYSLVPVYQMEITDGVTLSQKLAQVRSDPNVLYAEPNYRVQIDRTPNDPSFGMLWGLHNTGEGGGTADADIDAPEAWSRATGSRDIIVAVIDTGIDYNHVDLADNMWKNTGEIPTNGIDDDANGYVDDVYGYDFYNKDADPMDDHSHGTHCAGTIGAVGNNGVGVVGVNWRVKLMALKFLSSFGGGWDADAISAIEYAWRNGAKISNNSWGGYGYSQSLYDAIRAAELNGHLFVSSAGNYGLDNDVWPQYPASFDLNNIIAVAASDRKDEMPLWSNYGLTSVDLAAPGASIYSTILGGGYSSFDGTSMSAPHVAGVAALIASINPDLGYEQLKQYILDGVDEKAAFADKMLTDGRLNASKAVGGAGAMLLYLPFDDYGRTAEDFTKAEDWKTDWAHAGVFFRSGFSTNSYLDRQTDSDGDGMPDWWEIAVGLNPFSATGNDGHDGDGDGDGLKNYYEYLANTSPSAADTDRDGVSDFTEDPDNDGLTNGQEQDLGTLPRQADTDDDGINDNVELMFGNDPLDAFNPDLPRAYQFNGTGRLRVRSEQSSEVSTNWTVEAWVRPTNSTVSGIILRRAEKYPFGGIRWINYELGLANGIPYIRYVYRQTNITEVRVNALKAIGTNWTHLAGVHDAETRQLRLYVDGKRVNYAYPAELPPMPRYGTFETVIGGGDLGGGGASNGFRGAIDAVRMWTYPRSGVDIQDNRGVLFPELVAGVVDSSRGPVRLFNFDDGGVYAENSAFTNDWLTGWQHAAQVEGTAGGAVLAAAPFPPLNLDSDDDAISDVTERSNNTLELRSESPLVAKALHFNGAGLVVADEMVDGEETHYYALSNWTVEAWVNPAAPVAGTTPLVQRVTRDGNQATFELGLFNNGGVMNAYALFNRDDAGHAAFTLQGTGFAIPTGQWTHVAATFHDRFFALYVNGQEAVRSTDTGAEPVWNRTGTLRLGAIGYVGDLKEVRIWNRPRSAEQILEYVHKSLLFSVALLENVYHATTEASTFLGRDTLTEEDGYRYDFSTIGQLGDFPYLSGRLTHKFTMEAWVRMNRGSVGGKVIERKVDLMLIPNEPDWRTVNALLITDEGKPKVEWQGQVTVLTPDYGTNDVIKKIDSAQEVVSRNLTSEADVRDGTWHHVAAVGDGLTIKLYIDGVLDAESLSYYVFRARSAPSFESFYFTYPPIGNVLRIADDGIEADVDEVMIWNEDRTQAEIRQHMRYGLSIKDIRNGVRPIDPIPADALDDGNPHRDLISYVIFDGEVIPPFMSDMANDELVYRILPSPAGNEILANTRPPIEVDRLRALRDDLAGYFAADDGGATAENFMQRNDYEFAALLLGDASFAATASPTMLDSDGDDLPDWWETLNGFDAGSAEGVNGAWGDRDGDGLNNRAEYLAGTDPNDWDTDGDGFSDYDSRAGPGDRTWGELYTDGDGIPDDWEAEYPSAVSPLLYDAHLDPDGDGWNNYAEWASLTDPSDYSSYPQPVVPIVLKYNGENHNGPVLWRAYSTARMDGVPDARGSFGPSEGIVNEEIYTVPEEDMQSHEGTLTAIPVAPGSVRITVPCSPVELTYEDDGNGGLRTTDAVPVRFGSINYETGAWQLRTYPSIYPKDTKFCASWQYITAIRSYPFVGSALQESGHLRQTSTWFFAFIDNNGDATWNGCEPAGLAQLQPHDLTYGTMPQIEVGLTDGQPGYGRFDWASFGDECCYSYTVSVVNISVAGSPQVLYRAIRNRTYVHEGDFQYAGYTGGLPYASYQWYVYKSNGGVWTSGFFNAMYPASVAAPALTRPLGAELVFAKNQLVWGMDANSTQYRLQIRRTNSATGELIFDSLLKAPFDDNGTFTANLPYYAGEWLYGRNRGFDNGAYFWRVQSVNPRTSSSYSSWGSFMINLQEAALGASTISGEAFYFGKVLSTNRAANVVVEAFADFAFSGLPEARIVLTNKSNLSYKLMGLRPGTYYVRAYIDQNVNKKLDTWESWGFVKDTTMQAVDYQPKAITVPGNAVAQWLVLRDRDTDNDRIPDAWEYLNFGSLTTAGPGPVSGYTDWDGDGLNDLREYEISFEDTDPKNVDTDGDTLSDFFEVTYSDWRQGLPADPSHYDPYDPVRNPTGTDLDPHKTDTDGDGYSDYQEIFVLNTSPTSPLDVPGAREALLRSDPYGDFDGDGFLNIEEVVLGVNPFEAVDVPRVRGATEISGLAVGEALDVVRWRVPTNITTNIQVRLAVTTNLYQNYNLIPGAQRMVYKTNWFLGPWAWTNQPGAASRMYYRLEWDVP